MWVEEDTLPWTSDPRQAPGNVWITATWTASCARSVADKRWDQRIASNTLKANVCKWRKTNINNNSSYAIICTWLTVITQKKGKIPYHDSKIFAIASRVQTREVSGLHKIMLPYAWAAMFTPQYDCQIYQPLSTERTLTLLQRDRTDLAARGWKERAGGRKSARERKYIIQGHKHIQVFFIKQQPALRRSSKPRTPP